MADCKKVQKMIQKFENEQLNEKEEDFFVRHLESCTDCKEEFEIYYIIEYGLEAEENISDVNEEYKELLEHYDFKGLVELKLKNSRLKLEKIQAWKRFLKLCWYASNLCVLLALILFVIIRYY